MIYQPSIVLTETRCYDCGRYYAVEGARLSRCPYCAEAQIAASEKRREHLDRVIRSLRGAVTRLKRRGRK